MKGKRLSQCSVAESLLLLMGHIQTMGNILDENEELNEGDTTYITEQLMKSAMIVNHVSRLIMGQQPTLGGWR